MALDLFANFERSENGGVFYRPTSTSPFTLTAYLSDSLISNLPYTSVFAANISLNGAPPIPFPTVGNIFETSFSFSCLTECVCSISVDVFSIVGGGSSLFKTFSLSASFVDDMPEAKFILYPKYQPFFNSSTNAPDVLILNTANAETQSNGTSFYGEGHTEIFHLSASTIASGVSSVWFVGNDIGDILIDPNSRPGTLWPTLTAPSFNSAYVEISTTPSQEVTYPVSVLHYTDRVSPNSPIITYDDITGLPRYYSYFASTQDIDRSDHPLNNTLRDHIKVLQYPNTIPCTFFTPFPNSNITLPLDLGPETFLSYVSCPSGNTILTERFYGTQWSIKATSTAGGWGGPGDALTNTVILTSINAYGFSLGYDNIKNGILDYFTASPTEDTTVTVDARTYKHVVIDVNPFDWKSKTVAQHNSASTVVASLPYAKVYTPNYFNIKNNKIPFTVVSNSSGMFKLKRLWITSDKSPDSIVLTENDTLSGTLTFNEIGLADLIVTIVIVNQQTNTCVAQQSAVAEYLVSTTYENFIEIVEEYDTISPEHYQTNLTNIELPYTTDPKMTPNEWVIEDNFNDGIKKINSVVQTMERFTKIYEKKTCLYGWAGLTQTFQEAPAYVWQDLECPPSSAAKSSWEIFECDTTIPPITEHQWLSHEGNVSLAPALASGFGKYCVFWTWYERTRTNALEAISWIDTSSTGSYAKKWTYEPCEDDSSVLNCNRSSWKISNIDRDFFPYDYCEHVERCSFIDLERHESTDRLILAYPTEIQLAGLDYEFTYLSRHNKADELFPFQNIVGIDLGTTDDIFVLDSVLSRVSIFRFKNNKFELFASWGKYGNRTDKNGFKKPSDIHVDQHDVVWIADTGNNCIKKYTFNGKHLTTVYHADFDPNSPISMCVDSVDMLHVLVNGKVMVFDYEGHYSFEYALHKYATDPRRINTSYNRETIYIAYDTGIIKYFRTGTISYYIVNDHECTDGTVLKGYNSVAQDVNRNLYVPIGDKILKIPDLMKLIELKANVSDDLYWSTDELLVHKEEYIQPWVYLKSIHRLWDNIELLRSSLFYTSDGCKAPTNPIYEKEDFVIGKNELVSNAVWNRLFFRLWKNIETMFDYFDPNCEPEPNSQRPLKECSEGITYANSPDSKFATDQLPVPYKTINGPVGTSLADGLKINLDDGVSLDTLYYYRTTVAGGPFNTMTVYTNCSSRAEIKYDSSREGTIFGYSFDRTTIPQLTARFVNGDVINIRTI
jgi:hypothetical protein